MLRPVLQSTDSALRQPSLPVPQVDLVSPEIVSLKRDLLDTLLAQRTGVAISAVQIGVLQKVCLVYIQPHLSAKSFGPKYYFNPEIIESSTGTTAKYEGCLSVEAADLYGSVSRADKIRITYLDESGVEIREELTGFKARILQHEVDHMAGKLFSDIADTATFMSEAEYQKGRIAPPPS